jgi:pimeloyl-ACP methyl ester carboxylesterase
LRCGTISVPLRHEQPTGARIALAVAVLATTAKQPDGPPVIMLAGGPGEALVEDATALSSAGPASPLVAMRAERDLVLLDQRGVGASVPALNCTEDVAALQTLPDAAPTATITGTLVDAYRRCGTRLAVGTELSAFGTVEDAADLDSARQALGYQRVTMLDFLHQPTRAPTDACATTATTTPPPPTH